MVKPGTANKTIHLSRQLFVETALAVSDRDGVDKLSMRKVATHLGVSPMAMYKHFANKDELLVATLDAFIARADVIPGDDLEWDPWLEYVARRMYNALAGASTWAPYLGSLGLGPRAAAVSDAVVKKLVTAGFSISDALTAYYTVVQLVIGAVCLGGISVPVAAGTGEQGAASLSNFTRTYLLQADVRGLQIAAELDALIKRDQIDIGLPLIIDALRVRLSHNNK